MYYLRARYYDPAIGRFLSQDPAGAGHPFAYAENNPLRYADPYGLDIFDTVGGIAKGGWDCATDPIHCAEEAGENVIDQIHITVGGVLVGGLLIIAGDVLIAGGALCVVIVVGELEIPLNWVAAPHELGICGGMLVVGGALYVCGWLIALTDHCLIRPPAETAYAEPTGPGKE